MAESVQRREKASFHDTYQIAGVWRFLTAAAGDTDTVSLSGTCAEADRDIARPTASYQHSS